MHVCKIFFNIALSLAPYNLNTQKNVSLKQVIGLCFNV